MEREKSSKKVRRGVKEQSEAYFDVRLYHLLHLE